MKRSKKEEKDSKDLGSLLDSLKEILEEHKKDLIKDFAPMFKIHMESDEEGEGCSIEVEGNKPSLMIALAELASNLIEHTNLTEEDILKAVQTGIENAEE